ncbi:MAG: hypothetical protein E6K63_11350 [Nitrospirae bacterium]|nr:MAG: hypothetical protein E6K63_11350 [Nitrospirota bacterium]
MKIRRKLPKPSRAGRPLYLIGYSFTPPTCSDLQSWFDLEYGGPIRLRNEPGESTHLGQDSSAVLASHGPWSASFRISISSAEANEWRDRLGWGHSHAGQVVATSTSPGNACDQILFAARLAKGLTLLTDGTAYDVSTQAYLNPSDWKDLPLEQFRISDHLRIEQAEADRAGHDWFLTLGLAKFGLEELETFTPAGLPSQPIIERLTEIAQETLRLGHQPKVGTRVTMPSLGLSIQVVRHRNVARAGIPLLLREIAWHSLAERDQS